MGSRGKTIMKKSTAWILLSVLPLISSLPGPAKVGLEDLALEMVLCEELDGACNTLTEENLEPVVMKLEKAAEANELDFGENLYEELETRVGRLLCGLDYNQFCTEGGRSVLQEESALCRMEGINCRSNGRGRTLVDILEAKKQLLQAVLGKGDEDGSGETDEEAPGSGDSETDGAAAPEDEDFIDAGGNIEPAENSGDEESSGNEDGSGEEDLLKSVINSKVAAAKAVVDAKNDIAQAAISGVGALATNIVDVARDVVDAKTTLVKNSAKAAAIAADGAVKLTQAAVKGVIDVEVAAVKTTVDVVNAVVQAKTSIFKSVFGLLKKKINIVLCGFKLKC